MEDDFFGHDAFSTKNLWKPSAFFQDPNTDDSSLFAPLELDVSSITFDHPYAPKSALEDDLQLPDLESFEFGALPELDSFDSLDPPSSSSDDTPPLIQEEEIWQFAGDAGPANQDVRFFSWERFENSVVDQERTPYITEAGPVAFQAALLRDKEVVPAGTVVQEDIFLQSLWNLGLGSSSILFNWDEKLRTFSPRLPDGVACGFSPASVKSLLTFFILTGNTFRYLRTFSERTFASSMSIPARVALATAVSSILSTFEHRLGRDVNAIKSILQLQRLFAKPRDILLCVARMVDAVKHARTNEQVSSILYQRVLEVEGHEDLRILFSEILCKVSKPSMELVGEWLGTREGENPTPIALRGGFVEVDPDSEGQDPLEYIYNPGGLPTFVTPEDGSAIFETGNSLRFITQHHPFHPLVSPRRHGIQAPGFEWKFAWQDIEDISMKAQAYERDLRRAIQDFSCGFSKRGHANEAEGSPHDDATDDATLLDEVAFARQIDESARLFDRPPNASPSAFPDELGFLVSRLLDEADAASSPQSFSPPLSMTWALSFRPLLGAQAKLVNATTLRLFFRSHGLRMHLSLQRQYHLFGDGVFSSRLASALFDPEREAAERRKGAMRSGVHMGLQVGSRSSWPPASSELRLALMGVLSESFYSSALYYSTVRNGTTAVREQGERRDTEELPGQLNFAVRHLTEPEMEKVMDPDSLYALDFLRLQYMPPSPLHLVISSAALEKYDHIFRFLLRLLRMLFVISHLPRSYPNAEARYFRMEAHHFVTAISSYMFQTGIAEHWETFEDYLSTVESQLAAEDAAGEVGTRVACGLDSLRSAHEQCLDSIMFSLLLRRRQKKVLALLEEIFGHILLFAKVMRDAGESGQGVAERTRTLYAMLKGKIRVFISVCRGLTGKKGYGKGRGTAEENSLERLGVLLEMNGYYG